MYRINCACDYTLEYTPTERLPHVSHTDLYANDGADILDLHHWLTQHSFARTQLRGSRKSNLATAQNLTTPRSRTDLTSQLYECKHAHTHIQVLITCVLWLHYGMFFKIVNLLFNTLYTSISGCSYSIMYEL